MDDDDSPLENFKFDIENDDNTTHSSMHMDLQLFFVEKRILYFYVILSL